MNFIIHQLNYLYTVTHVCSLHFLYQSSIYWSFLKTTMPDFTLFLPPEICSTILSHVNQVDCIECMTVCHRWYELIPQCGKDLWTELKISENSSSRCNNAMLECLGTHVKNVNIISPENSNKILRQLERQQCNIQSLGK